MIESLQHTDNNPAKAIRKEFFAFRNGIIADKLRRAGDPHTIIMGCLLVDVINIARKFRDDIHDSKERAALAQELWNDTLSRECRLAAPMIYPPELMTHDLAMAWCQGIETVEVADNLCHKLLRHASDGMEISSTLIASQDAMMKYTGYRLLLNLLLLGKAQPCEALKKAVNDDLSSAQPPLTSLLQDVMEELNNPQE